MARGRSASPRTTPSPPWTPTSQCDTYVLNSTNQRKVVRDAVGRYYVIYTKYSGSAYTVRLARSTDCGGSGSTCTWTTVTLFGSGGIVNTGAVNWISPSIEVSADRTKIHVVVVDNTHSAVYYTKCTDIENWNSSSCWFAADGTTQGSSTSPTASQGTHQPLPAVAVDSSGNAHVVFERTTLCTTETNQIKYIKYTGSAWSSETSISAGCTSGIKRVKPAIDIGYNDVVHIAYLDYISGSGHPTAVIYCNSSDSFVTKTNVLYESNSWTAKGFSLASLAERTRCGWWAT